MILTPVPGHSGGATLERSKENKTTTLKEGYKLDLGEILTSSVRV